MASGAEYFLKKTLGEDFLKSLEKVELWKPGTKSTIDHEELKTALQIVPRTIMALLIRELAPLKIGDNHKFELPVPGGAILTATKHERDVYSGEITQGSAQVVEFKLRALPGVGLVIMSAFELYDMDNLINSTSPENDHESEHNSEKIQRMIDDRLELHDLIGRVVDKKIMEKDAIHKLVLRRLTEMVKESKAKDAVVEAAKMVTPTSENCPIAPALAVLERTETKKRPLEEFLDKRKKKHEYSVVMAKNETVSCPDCGKNIFDGRVFAGCICLGDDMERKVFIKKNEDGIKVRFSKGWDEENIEMLLEVLRKKRG